jgi:MraZ protein
VGILWSVVAANGMRWGKVVFTGTYRRHLDEKQRLALPKPLREALADAGDNTLFVAPGTDRSLNLYPGAVLESLGRALSHVSPVAQDARRFSRLFYAQMQPAELDRQGRLRVPTELHQWAGLGSEVVLVGVRDHMEIWSTELWERFLGENQEEFDRLAEAALGHWQLPVTPGSGAVDGG